MYAALPSNLPILLLQRTTFQYLFIIYFVIKMHIYTTYYLKVTISFFTVKLELSKIEPQMHFCS